MKIRFTPAGGEPKEYPFAALEQSSTASLFALQRATGKVMPKELERLREAEDVLTLTYYTVWLVLWRSGDKLPLEEVFEGEIEMVSDATDEAAVEETEEDPTAAPTDSARGESADAA